MLNRFRLLVFSTIWLLGSNCLVFAQDEAQTAADYVEIGDEIYFNQRAFEEAKNYYVQAAELDPDNLKAHYMAG